jgi:acetolactate synthase-1/2/3 large subunit
VISIHNMPILDALHQRGEIRFVSARGEAGAATWPTPMRASPARLGVCVTSTGTGAGNAAGALVEALTAGTPLLHLTGQIETPYIDKGMAYIHEAPTSSDAQGRRQGGLPHPQRGDRAGHAARSGAARVHAAVRPGQRRDPDRHPGPLLDLPADLTPLPIELPLEASPDAVRAHAWRLQEARARCCGWAAARAAGKAASAVCRMGWGVVTTTQGRGVVPEDDPAFARLVQPAQAGRGSCTSCDAMLVVGSRLRGNETLKYKLKLPQPAVPHRRRRPAAEGRGYASEQFVHGDAERWP